MSAPPKRKGPAAAATAREADDRFDGCLRSSDHNHDDDGYVNDDDAGFLDPAADWPAPDRRFIEPETPAPPSLPCRDIFGARWSEWIAAAAEAKGAPRDYVAAALLVAAASLVGNARWAAPRPGWSEPPTLWAALIGAPSSGKSPAMDAVLGPLRDIERDARAEAEPERAAWAERAEVSKIALAAWKEGVAAALKAGKEPPPRPEAADPGPEPHTPRLAVNDATIERLAVILSRQSKGTLVVRDELAGWLSNMSRYSSGGSDRPFWLEAWGGRAYTVERMGRDPVRIDRLAVPVVGGIQPDRLQSLLIRGADDDGLMARILPIWPDPAPIVPPRPWSGEGFVRAAFGRLHDLQMATDETGTPRPVFVPFAPAAELALDALRIEARAAEARHSGLMVSFIGKAAGLAVRLALVLAHLDWAAGGDAGEPREIDAPTFARAAAFVTSYLWPMASRCYGAAAAPEAERRARTLARLIVAERLGSFSTREITRRGRSGLTDPGEVRAAADRLVEADILAERIARPGPQGGRSSPRYEANPRLWGRN